MKAGSVIVVTFPLKAEQTEALTLESLWARKNTLDVEPSNFREGFPSSTERMLILQFSPEVSLRKVFPS